MNTRPSQAASHAPSDALAAPAYVLLVGHGGSGTKRVLHMLDLSSHTHCRMEPNLHRDSLLAQLPCGYALENSEHARMDSLWDNAIAELAHTMGSTDRVPLLPKRHMRRYAHHLRLWSLLRARPSRQVLALVNPALRRQQWPVPRWICPNLADHARLVVKLNKVPDWAAWVLQHRRQVLVIHVVRHPGGYLHAWKRRWLDTHDTQQVCAANRRRLQMLTQTHLSWSQRITGITTMDAAEAELWFWLYACLSIHEPGSRSLRYLLLRDEEVIADPVATARRLYAACGIPWEPAVEANLQQQQHHWQQATAPWRELIDAQRQALIDRMFESCSIERWWDRDQRVSLIDYDAY